MDGRRRGAERGLMPRQAQPDPAAGEKGEPRRRAVAGVILAAGQSRRLGQPKQLLPLAGRPLLQHAVSAACASALDEVVVVLGSEAAVITAALDLGRAQTVHNPHYAEGQSTSLHCGLAALGDETDAALFLLGDQPGVTPALVDGLVAAYRASTASIVAPEYADGLGNPVLFDRACWPDLLAIQGDVGARDLLRARRADIHVVPVASQRLADVDTWEEYQRLAVGP